MGSSLRYGYTALGDTVNLASRLEGLNKDYGTHILASQSTFEQVAEAPAAPSDATQFVFRELDLIRVKGKTQPVGLYELLGPREALGDSTELDERLAQFARGLALYRDRQWAAAQAIFASIIERWPDDGPARVFRERCQEYLVDGPQSGWDGVFTMTHK
jgi:adenylate cyclase